MQLTAQPQLDRNKVLSEGKNVTGKLLVELQVRKSTADGKGAKEFYTDLTNPPPEWEGEIRDFVLKKKLVGVSVETPFDLAKNSPAASENFCATQYIHGER